LTGIQSGAHSRIQEKPFVRGCVKIQFGSLGFGEVAIKKFIIRNLVEKDNNGDFKSKIAFESDIFFFTIHHARTA
jgi:hypothetical protein